MQACPSFVLTDFMTIGLCKRSLVYGSKVRRERGHALAWNATRIRDNHQYIYYVVLCMYIQHTCMSLSARVYCAVMYMSWLKNASLCASVVSRYARRWRSSWIESKVRDNNGIHFLPFQGFGECKFPLLGTITKKLINCVCVQCKLGFQIEKG